MDKNLMIEEKNLMASGADTLDAICEYVCGGGTLPEWCELHKVRYGVISCWINGSPDRVSPYAKATMMRAEWFEQTIYKQLRALVNQDIRGLLNEDGTIKDVEDWPDDMARAVAGYEVDDIFNKDGEMSGVKKKLKLGSKEKALELLMKNFRMLTERVEHTGRVSLEQLVEDSNKVESQSIGKLGAVAAPDGGGVVVLDAK